MTAPVRRAAWQAMALLACLALLAAALLASHRAPFDAETLGLPVSALHSQAAEAAMLDGALDDGRVAPGFARRHAAQLRRAAARERDALIGKEAPASLAPARAQARALASRLDASLQADATRVQDDREQAERGRDACAALAERLDALRVRIERLRRAAP